MCFNGRDLLTAALKGPRFVLQGQGSLMSVRMLTKSDLMKKQTDSQTNKHEQASKQTKLTSKQTGKQSIKQTARERERDRETDSETLRQIR